MLTPIIEKPRVLALANQKGGVGKTTTAINLATALAAVGMRTLILDMDPQGNASTGLGIGRHARSTSIYEVLLGEADLTDAAVPSGIPNLDIVPSTIDLSGAELELVEMDRRAHRLRDAIDRQVGPGAMGFGRKPLDYAYVLVDCPPSLNLLSLNAMVAADAVLVPLQCEFFALEGLSLLLKTIERVRHTLNPGLDIQGVVLTMFDRRNNLCEQVARDVRTHLGAKVYQTVIPRNVRISEAPSHGKPALIYDYRCPGSEAYMRLAGEVLRQERARLAA